MVQNERVITQAELMAYHPVLGQACRELGLTPIRYWEGEEANHAPDGPEWIQEKVVDKMTPWEKHISPDVDNLLYWPTAKLLWSVVGSSYYAVLVA